MGYKMKSNGLMVEAGKGKSDIRKRCSSKNTVAMAALSSLLLLGACSGGGGANGDKGFIEGIVDRVKSNFDDVNPNHGEGKDGKVARGIGAGAGLDPQMVEAAKKQADLFRYADTETIEVPLYSPNLPDEHGLEGFTMDTRSVGIDSEFQGKRERFSRLVNDAAREATASRAPSMKEERSAVGATLVARSPNGLNIMVKKGKWGLVAGDADKNSRVAAPFVYDAIYPHSHGRAVFKRKGSWGYLDNFGREVFSAPWSFAFPYNGKRAVVLAHDGKSLLVDTEGRELAYYPNFVKSIGGTPFLVSHPFMPVDSASLGYGDDVRKLNSMHLRAARRAGFLHNPDTGDAWNIAPGDNDFWILDNGMVAGARMPFLIDFKTGIYLPPMTPMDAANPIDVGGRVVRFARSPEGDNSLLSCEGSDCQQSSPIPGKRWVEKLAKYPIIPDALANEGVGGIESLPADEFGECQGGANSRLVKTGSSNSSSGLAPAPRTQLGSASPWTRGEGNHGGAGETVLLGADPMELTGSYSFKKPDGGDLDLTSYSRLKLLSCSENRTGLEEAFPVLAMAAGGEANLGNGNLGSMGGDASASKSANKNDSKRLFRDGVAVVGDASGYGMIDSKGKVVVKPSYEDAKVFPHGPWWFMNSGGKWGALDSKGNMVVPFAWDDVLGCRRGLCPVKSNGLWGYVDERGVPVIPVVFKWAGLFPADGPMLAQVAFRDGGLLYDIDPRGIPLDVSPKNCPISSHGAIWCSGLDVGTSARM